MRLLRPVSITQKRTVFPTCFFIIDFDPMALHHCVWSHLLQMWRHVSSAARTYTAYICTWPLLNRSINGYNFKFTTSTYSCYWFWFIFSHQNNSHIFYFLSCCGPISVLHKNSFDLCSQCGFILHQMSDRHLYVPLPICHISDISLPSPMIESWLPHTITTHNSCLLLFDLPEPGNHTRHSSVFGRMKP